MKQQNTIKQKTKMAKYIEGLLFVNFILIDRIKSITLLEW
jgi:hypothetical protein